MIELQKMNKERFLLNHNQIECIELIPECKIVMMNHDYYLVRNTVEEIMNACAPIAHILDMELSGAGASWRQQAGD